VGILERVFPSRREAASERNSTAEDFVAGADSVSDSAGNGCCSDADAVDCDSDYIPVELRRGAGDIVELFTVARAGGARRREREAEERERSVDQRARGDEIALQQYICSHVKLRQRQR